MSILKDSNNNNELSLLAKPYNIILGSGSFTRKLILNNNNIPFTIFKADVDEKSIGDRSSDPRSLVQLLAIAKANAVINKLKDNKEISNRDNILVLTADQVVTFKGKILEKPDSIEEARKFINQYVNNSCTTIGSIALTHLDSGVQVCDVDSATIHFGSIPDTVVEEILSEDIVLSCAGGLMVEHPSLQPYIVEMQGTQESLMGLSTGLLQSLLTKINNTLL